MSARARRAAWIALAALATSGVARAQPHDVVTGAGLAGALQPPPTPSTWVTERRESLTITYPREIGPVVRVAVAHAAADARAVTRQLGLSEVPAWSVRLVPDADALRRWAPRAMPPPTYAVGVAYPPVGLALVATRAPGTFDAVDVRQVLRHEVSHLALAAAVGDASTPRWFSEGLAVEQAGEHTFERFQRLATASYSGGVLPWARLDAGFADGPGDVNVAYAQSADVVAWMLRAEGRERFAVLLTQLRAGRSFAEAIRETYGVSAAAFEERWREDFRGRFALAPLWAGTGILTLLGLVVVAIAMVRRRRKSKATLARWEREERLKRQRALLTRWLVFTPGASVEERRDDEPRVLH